VLLYRYTGQEDILVGSPIASRPRTEVEGLIGFFLNNLVLRTRLSGQSSFREVFECVRRTAIEAYANQDLPFERLVEELKPARDLNRTPIFQIFFNLLKFTDDQITLLGLTEETISAAGVWSQSDEAWSQFDLTLYALERAEEVDLILVYSTDLFAPASIARLVRQFQVLLRHAVAQPDEPISGLPMMTDSEREALIEDFKEDFEYA
jgi:non-ribosomal peptide synthetase component F